MNPESSSYGETLYEDSFEHTGDLMLMQEIGDKITTKDSKRFTGKLIELQSGQRATVEYTDQKKYEDALKKTLSGGTPKFEKVGEPVIDYLEYIYTEDEIWKETGEYTTTSPTYDTFADLQETSGKFTYTKDEDDQMTFDPTSGEFQESVTEAGGYEELVAGFGLTDYQQYFDEANLDELGFLEQEQELLGQKFGEGGTEAAKIDLEQKALEETKRAGEAQYGTARKQAGLQAGASLFDIKRQTEEAGAASGFAGSGAAQATGRRAQRGVMADYRLQQEELASGLKGVQTAYSLGTEGTGIATTELGQQGAQAGIDYERSLSQFWDTMEEKFYGELQTVEALKQG